MNAETVERLEILRRIGERGLALACKHGAMPARGWLNEYERGLANAHEEHLDLWQHLLDELARVSREEPDQLTPDELRTSDEEIKRVCDRLESSDPDFDDCADAVRLITALQIEREASADWKARAIEERQRRVAAESRDANRRESKVEPCQ